MVLFGASVTAWGAPRGAPAQPAFEEPHGADLNQGKSPAEIFRSDCTVCHKTPQGLARDQSSLKSFLRQHYTTGEPQAASLAAYLASVGGGRAPAGKPSPTAADRPQRPEPSASPQKPEPATASRRPAAGPEAPASDGMTTPPGERPRHPSERAKSAEPAQPPAEPETPAETANAPEKPPAPPTPPPAQPSRKRSAKQEETAKPPQTRRERTPRTEEAKPAEPEKPATLSTRTAEPAPAAVAPPAEPKPAAQPAPEIPL